MIWIECDCCHKTLAKHEPYVNVQVTGVGGVLLPVSHTEHLCESCYFKIRKAAEVVRHDT